MSLLEINNLWITLKSAVTSLAWILNSEQGLECAQGELKGTNETAVVMDTETNTVRDRPRRFDDISITVPINLINPFSWHRAETHGWKHTGTETQAGTRPQPSCEKYLTFRSTVKSLSASYSPSNVTFAFIMRTLSPIYNAFIHLIAAWLSKQGVLHY